MNLEKRTCIQSMPTQVNRQEDLYNTLFTLNGIVYDEGHGPATNYDRDELRNIVRAIRDEYHITGTQYKYARMKVKREMN